MLIPFMESMPNTHVIPTRPQQHFSGISCGMGDVYVCGAPNHFNSNLIVLRAKDPRFVHVLRVVCVCGRVVAQNKGTEDQRCFIVWNFVFIRAHARCGFLSNLSEHKYRWLPLQLTKWVTTGIYGEFTRIRGERHVRNSSASSKNLLFCLILNWHSWIKDLA